MFDAFNEAVAFATAAHAGQCRKLSGIPYILHPMEVSAIAATMSNSEDLLIAALLHDTVEDCGVEPAEIKRRFGARVAALVQSETEDKHLGGTDEETWQQRKEDSLLMLANTRDPEVKMLWLADKLSNVRSFYREYRKVGNAVWQSCHQKDPAMQAWYYRTIASYLSDLAETAAYAEYTQLLEKLFVSIKEAL